MAILTDIFVAPPKEAQEYEGLAQAGRFDVFEGAQFKGLTTLEFCMLWAMLQRAEFDFDRHALESLAPEGETWLFRFPPEFVEQLAALTPAAVKRFAKSWAEIDELQWDPTETEEVLVEMVRLAKLAIASKQGMFFWGSL